MTDQELKARIMGEVGRIYWLRKAINYLTIKLYALGILSVGLLSTVSVQNVIANMPPLADVAAVARFMLSAVVNTEVIVQILFMGALVVAALFVADIVRQLANLRQPHTVRA